MTNRVREISSADLPVSLTGPVTVVVSQKAALSENGMMDGIEVILEASNIVPYTPSPTPGAPADFLSHFNNVGSSTLIDEKGGTFVSNNVPQALSSAKFGAAGGTFTGAEAAVLTGDYSVPLNGDFTLDFWAANNHLEAVSCPVMFQAAGGSGYTLIAYVNDTGAGGGSLMCYYGAGNLIYRIAKDTDTGLWAHCAICRSSNVLRTWINGSFIGKATTGIAFNSGRLIIGYDAQSGVHNPFRGKIDEVRFSKDTAVWTTDANFTPPTAPYAGPTPGVPVSPTLQLHGSGGTDKVGDIEWAAIEAAVDVTAEYQSIRHSATTVADSAFFPLKPTLRAVVDVPSGASIDVVSVKLRD